MKTIDHLQKALQSTTNPEVEELIRQAISRAERMNTQQYWQPYKGGIYRLYHNGLTFEATSHGTYWGCMIFTEDPNGSRIDLLSMSSLKTLADIETVCLTYAQKHKQ